MCPGWTFRPCWRSSRSGCVAKSDVRAWPVIGLLAARGGTLFIDRDRLRRLPAPWPRSPTRLRDGQSVLVFPEGSTWCGRTQGRFYPASFQAAIDAGAPVRPVALRYRLADGSPTTAAAFVGDDTLIASVLAGGRHPRAWSSSSWSGRPRPPTPSPGRRGGRWPPGRHPDPGLRPGRLTGPARPVGWHRPGCRLMQPFTAAGLRRPDGARGPDRVEPASPACSSPRGRTWRYLCGYAPRVTERLTLLVLIPERPPTMVRADAGAPGRASRRPARRR